MTEKRRGLPIENDVFAPQWCSYAFAHGKQEITSKDPQIKYGFNITELNEHFALQLHTKPL